MTSVLPGNWFASLEDALNLEEDEQNALKFICLFALCCFYGPLDKFLVSILEISPNGNHGHHGFSQKVHDINNVSIQFVLALGLYIICQHRLMKGILFF